MEMIYAFYRISDKKKEHMIKYKAYIYFTFGKIESIKIEKETDHYVWLRNKKQDYREAKECSYHEYFNTWGEAHERLKELIADRVLEAQLKLNSEEALLDRIYQMEEK
jgi:hypothetical protein